MQNIDKPGAFYLGREHDLTTGRTGSKALLYDSRDLTTHAVCVGMTGSGKTGLCLSLLKQARAYGLGCVLATQNPVDLDYKGLANTGTGKLHFVRDSYQLDHWREVAVLQPIDGKLPEPLWESALEIAALPKLQDDPQVSSVVNGVEHEDPEYDSLVSELAREKNYKSWRIDLKNTLYRAESCILWRCEQSRSVTPGGSSGGLGRSAECIGV